MVKYNITDAGKGFPSVFERVLLKPGLCVAHSAKYLLTKRERNGQDALRAYRRRQHTTSDYIINPRRRMRKSEKGGG